MKTSHQTSKNVIISDTCSFTVTGVGDGGNLQLCWVACWAIVVQMVQRATLPNTVSSHPLVLLGKADIGGISDNGYYASVLNCYNYGNIVYFGKNIRKLWKCRRSCWE